jgi:predicted phosphodiesterase
MSILRIIGDVHGLLHKYVPLAKAADYSLCVGDVGFDYSYLDRTLDPGYHKAIGGNHDNYTSAKCEKCNGDGCDTCQSRGYVFSKMSSHFLKDYGTYNVPGFEPIFYTRGAWSIDHQYRTIGITWWVDEELTRQQCENAIAEYENIKPEFVVTHTCPASIIPYFFTPNIFGDKIQGSRTEMMLDEMYRRHQPKIWIFGHWHKEWQSEIPHSYTGKQTKFTCLPELGYVDFPLTTGEVVV